MIEAGEATAVPRGLLRRVLPRGRTLPEGIWHARHLGILGLLWAHAAMVPVYGLVQGFSAAHSFLEAGVVIVPALLATTPKLDRRLRTLASSIGLLSSSAVLVHLSGGLIEMHFHFFVMVAVVALYQDWLPFLAAIAYVFIHHGLMGAIDPTAVYNHPAAWRSPWRWAGVHALFVSGISVACLVTWRLNEHYLERQRRTEERLREETRVVETLNEVGKTLAAELDLQRVVQAVTDAGTKLTNATYGAFFYNVTDDESGESYMLYSLSGATREAFAHMPMPRNTDIFHATFSGSSVERLADVTADPRYGNNPPYKGLPAGHLPVRSYLAVPVRSRGGSVIGGLFFAHPKPGVFSAVDERLAVGIAAQAAIAIDNARLYESEHRSRVASEAAQRNLGTLAEASKVLTSSLEVATILDALARLVVREVASECAVHLIGEDGSIDRAAHASASGSTPAPDPLPADEDNPVIRAVRRRQTQVLRGTGVTVVVPLLGRGEEIGTLSVSAGEGDSRLDEAAVHLIEELGRRAALAVENARLYARQRSVAETLQRSLLPQELPAIPGISAAARYIPGGPGVEVGGDWFDVLHLPGGEIALAMGDVVGRGERAASLMGQLRSALRAYAHEGLAPTEIVERLNRLLNDLGPENMATMVFAALEPDTGTLRVVSAGHPPPLVLGPEKTATFLEPAPGVPLGALPHAHYSETVTTLVPGATILLYTDGLVEDRATTLDEGTGRLCRAALDGPEDLEALCEHILARTLDGRDSQDDIALLVMRLEQLGDRLALRLPCRLGSLSPLRAAMRRWLVSIGASEDEVFEILVASGEACANAIRHAGGPAASSFDFEAVFDGDVLVRVADNGRWRTPRANGDGRGLSIMQTLMDDVRIASSDSGTEVTMRKRLGAHRQEPVTR